MPTPNSPGFLDGDIVALEELGKTIDLLAEGGHVMGSGRAVVQAPEAEDAAPGTFKPSKPCEPVNGREGGLLPHRNNSHRAVLFLNEIRYRYVRSKNPARPDK
jgi:hypothetical protein